MTRKQMIVRIAPMMVIPWIRSTIGVILPGLIDSFGLTIAQAGLVSIFLESGSVVGMLALGFVIDRIGATRVVSWGLPVMGLSLFAVTISPSFWALAPTLFSVGIGIALTASGVNMLMASTGERRGFYLGVLHSSFSVFAIITPLIAGVLLTTGSWQTYYLVVAVLAILVAVAFRLVGVKGQGNSPDAQYPTQSRRTPHEDYRDNTRSTSSALKSIAPVCLGVFALAGVQSIFITWSYLYMVTQYDLSHALATLAPSLLWVGILVMRGGAITLSRRFSARTILLWSITCSLAVAVLEQMAGQAIVSLGAVVLLGMGVAGAFQLGTAWAADRIPHRIGTASSAIMASASLGIGVWPWLTAIAIEATDFSAMMYTAFVGLIASGAIFALTPATKP